METKICNKCGTEKPLTDFYKRLDAVDGRRNDCKICSIERSKKTAILNDEKISKYRKKRYIENKKTISQKRKVYYIENSEIIKEKRKTYYKQNKEKINKNETIKRKKKYHSDRFFALKENIRTNLKKIFKTNNFSKKNRTIDILGCSSEQFKLFIESKWESWMNWDNYGLYNGELNYGWDIDHIIPTSLAEDEETLIRLWYYSNLQPLCSYYNRHIKRNKVNL